MNQKHIADESWKHHRDNLKKVLLYERFRHEVMHQRGFHLCIDSITADDVMQRSKLHKYQNSYAAAMKPFGLQRGIVGSTAKHQANSEYYKQQVGRYEKDIARLQADVEKAQEGKNTILSWFGKGDLAKAKKELTEKGRADNQTERSNPDTHSRERATAEATHRPTRPQGQPSALPLVIRGGTCPYQCAELPESITPYLDTGRRGSFRGHQVPDRLQCGSSPF